MNPFAFNTISKSRSTTSPTQLRSTLLPQSDFDLNPNPKAEGEWPEADESLEVFASSSRLGLSSVEPQPPPSSPKYSPAVPKAIPREDDSIFGIAEELKLNLEESFAAILGGSSHASIKSSTSEFVRLDDSAELLRSFKAAVKALMRDHFGSDTVVDDNSEPGLQLLDALERILAHGLKEEINGVAVSYWNFLNQFHRLGEDGIDGKYLCTEVDSILGESATNGDRGRCWLRLALNKRSISLLGSLLDRTEIISSWYTYQAFLMNPDLIAQVSHLLVSIEPISFSFLLTPKQHVRIDEGNEANEFSVVSKKKKPKRGLVSEKKSKKLSKSTDITAIVPESFQPIVTATSTPLPKAPSSPPLSPKKIDSIPINPANAVEAVGNFAPSNPLPPNEVISQSATADIVPNTPIPPSVSPSPTALEVAETMKSEQLQLNLRDLAPVESIGIAPSSILNDPEVVIAKPNLPDVNLEMFDIDELLRDDASDSLSSSSGFEQSLESGSLIIDSPLSASIPSEADKSSIKVENPMNSNGSRNVVSTSTSGSGNLKVLDDLDAALKMMEDIDAKISVTVAPHNPQNNVFEKSDELQSIHSLGSVDSSLRQETILSTNTEEQVVLSLGSDPKASSTPPPRPSQKLPEESPNPTTERKLSTPKQDFESMMQQEQERRSEELKKQREEQRRALVDQINFADDSESVSPPSAIPPLTPSYSHMPFSFSESYRVSRSPKKSSKPSRTNPFDSDSQTSPPSFSPNAILKTPNENTLVPLTPNPIPLQGTSNGANHDPLLEPSFTSPTSSSGGVSFDSKLMESDDLFAPAAVSLEDFLKGDFKPLATARKLPSPISQIKFDDDDELEGVMTTKKDSWTPPKKQIFFREHTQGRPEDQFNMCAGCGVQISVGWFSGPRYCRYSGKYYCSKCHVNAKEIVPARILWHWDFTPQAVSNFYQKFLIDVHKERLFDVGAINLGLYKMVPKLKVLKLLRVQLKFLRSYVASCRDHEKLLQRAKGQEYLYETSLLSVADFVDIYNGGIVPGASQLVNDWRNHVRTCPVCSSKGFVCEVCHNPAPIFPFDLKLTTQCPDCLGVFHRVCFKGKEGCSKCARIRARRTSTTKK